LRLELVFKKLKNKAKRSVYDEDYFYEAQKKNMDRLFEGSSPKQSPCYEVGKIIRVHGLVKINSKFIQIASPPFQGGLAITER
jgi:hypothetical protein